MQGKTGSLESNAEEAVVKVNSNSFRNRVATDILQANVTLLCFKHVKHIKTWETDEQRFVNATKCWADV